MAIETIQFDLPMMDDATGLYMTANVYTIDGVKNVDGSLRELSIGQLVMAICLQRAAELETSIISKMASMQDTSELLGYMTEAEQKVVDYFTANPSAGIYSGLNTDKASNGKTYAEILREAGVFNASQCYVRNDAIYSDADMLYDTFVSTIEAKMDENNSFSQQTMIELQSETNKRDQSYDMISNILKSLNNVMVGIANNT